MLSRVLVAVALVASAACSIDKIDSPRPPTDPAEVEYARSLNVDLSAMTRTSSGLYMQDVVVGDGTVATEGSTITVDYTGWLTNGTMFDRSKDHPTGVLSSVLSRNSLIAGWVEGMVGMKEGGKRRLIIPPELAYGARGSGVIPPYAVLVFDIELIDVN